MQSEEIGSLREENTRLIAEIEAEKTKLRQVMEENSVRIEELEKYKIDSSTENVKLREDGTGLWTDAKSS